MGCCQRPTETWARRGRGGFYSSPPLLFKSLEGRAPHRGMQCRCFLCPETFNAILTRASFSRAQPSRRMPLFFVISVRDIWFLPTVYLSLACEDCWGIVAFLGEGFSHDIDRLTATWNWKWLTFAISSDASPTSIVLTNTCRRTNKLVAWGTSEMDLMSNKILWAKLCSVSRGFQGGAGSRNCGGEKKA